MKLFLPFSLVVLLLFSCSKEDSFLIEEPTIERDYTSDEINDFIHEQIQDGTVFDWSDAPLDMIYSASQISDKLIAIGYTIPTVPDVKDVIGLEDKLAASFITKRSEIVQVILENERLATGNPTLELDEILPFGLDDEIPTIEIIISSYETLVLLNNETNIRYIEPMGYDPSEFNSSTKKSSALCNGYPSSINSNDYTNTSTYNAKIPWNFSNHNIPSAWNSSAGDNISICIIDTGASDSQDNLGSAFQSGNSSGRFIQKYSTKYSGWWWSQTLDSPNDPCGHGTLMAGLAAAPWATDGNAMGVAYKANLVSVRAVEDVLISSSYEKKGVKEALKLAGNRSDVKIVSMSIGNIISSGTVKDGIYYAYNRGKLLIAAAGTSTSFTNWTGVVFPANMNQTVAVTGVKEQSSYQRCNSCHSGSKVDFTIQMQRSYDYDRTSLAISAKQNGTSYVGGSSAATATTAGIAALVWSTNPSMSRSSVINRLKQASEIYPSRSGSYGWGNINALSAVSGNNY